MDEEVIGTAVLQACLAASFYSWAWAWTFRVLALPIECTLLGNTRVAGARTALQLAATSEVVCTQKACLSACGQDFKGEGPAT